MEVPSNNKETDGSAVQPARLDLPKWVWWVPAVALLFAILPLPYTYYMGLRWLVAVTAFWIAWKEFDLGGNSVSTYVVIFASIGIVFNPIAPVHLFKLAWVAINLITAAAYLGHMRLRAN